MSTLEHLYTFQVERPALAFGDDAVIRFEASANADSPAEAEAIVRRRWPSSGRMELVLVSCGDFGPCSDERCAVCYPSSRNGGTL